MSGDNRDAQTYAIIGAAMEVHREMGCGFLEAIYHQSMMVELGRRCIPFLSQVELKISYKGIELDCLYRADFVCFGEVIVELKAMKQLGPIERAQVLNYLKATGFKRALLLNFGCESLEYERIVLNA